MKKSRNRPIGIYPITVILNSPGAPTVLETYPLRVYIKKDYSRPRTWFRGQWFNVYSRRRINSSIENDALICSTAEHEIDMPDRRRKPWRTLDGPSFRDRT